MSGPSRSPYLITAPRDTERVYEMAVIVPTMTTFHRYRTRP